MTKKTKGEEKLEKEVHELQKKNAELKDHLQRSLAEFDNYKKRLEKEACDNRFSASKDIITKLLPVLDNLELAVKNSSDPEELAKGVKLIFAQFTETLEKEGVKKIETVGKNFDPTKHEALMQVESDEDGKVLEEFQPGYLLCEKVLRHSKVKVGKKTGKEKKDDPKGHEKRDTGKAQ